jgi:excisionase family DNA binding protein
VVNSNVDHRFNMCNKRPMGCQALRARRRAQQEGLRMRRDERLLTVQEVATRMRVSSMTVYRLIKSGELRASRIGHSYRLRKAEVDAYLERGMV